MENVDSSVAIDGSPKNAHGLEKLDPFDIFDREAARLDAFFSSLDNHGWNAPSRCAGWSVRDVLAHLAGEELYNHACLNDDVANVFARLQSQGVQSIDEFNEWCVLNRRPIPIGEVLDEWRAKNGETRRRMRDLGSDAMLPTMTGPYAVGLQTLHYSSEYATHGDDVGVPIRGDEDDRLRWRALFGRFALAEQNSPVEVTEAGDEFAVSLDGVSATLSVAEFVDATVHRLPDDHPLDDRLATALVSLA